MGANARHKYKDLLRDLKVVESHSKVVRGIIDDDNLSSQYSTIHLLKAWDGLFGIASRVLGRNKEFKYNSPEVASLLGSSLLDSDELVEVLTLYARGIEAESRGIDISQLMNVFSEIEIVRLCELLEKALDKFPRLLREKLEAPFMSVKKVAASATLIIAVVFLLNFLTPKNYWRAIYFEGSDFDQEIFSTEVSKLDIDWGADSPYFKISKENFSAKFFTCLELDEITTVLFSLNSDDGSRLYVDDQLIIDHWGEHGLEDAKIEEISLGPGRFLVRIEYYENDGMARVLFNMNLFVVEGGERVQVPAKMRLPKTTKESKFSC